MARTGPLTKDTSTVALGLAQIRVGSSADNITVLQPSLVAADSIGALADTKYTGETDWFRLESGYPLMEDVSYPIREKAMLECSFKELTPINLALAYGYDPNESPYSEMTVHSGEVPLGNRTSPAFVRMEGVYTYPNGTNTMTFIFPRAQVTSTVEIDMSAEDAAAVPIAFEAKRADSGIAGGSSVWDDKALGRIEWG